MFLERKGVFPYCCMMLVNFEFSPRGGHPPGLIPSLGSPGCGTRDFLQRGTGCVCTGVCACVSPGRRVLELPGSPSALNARSAWVPNWVLKWFPSAPGCFQKRNEAMCIWVIFVCDTITVFILFHDPYQLDIFRSHEVMICLFLCSFTHSVLNSWLCHFRDQTYSIITN